MADAKYDGRTPLLQNESTTETPVSSINQPQTVNYHHNPYQNAPPAEYYPYVNQGSHVTPSYTTNIPQRAENQGQFSLVPPKDYFPLTIFVTFCCCFPFGLVAILMSLQVQSRFKNDDYDGALKASQAAKVLSILAIVFGMMSIVGALAAIITASVAANVHPEPPDYPSYYDHSTD